VFPTSTGTIEHHKNMLRSLAPAMRAAGMSDKLKHLHPDIFARSATSLQKKRKTAGTRATVLLRPTPCRRPGLGVVSTVEEVFAER
jgi:hypothetical protein